MENLPQELFIYLFIYFCIDCFFLFQIYKQENKTNIYIIYEVNTISLFETIQPKN